MKVKNNRLEALKMLISSQELSSQEQLLQALHKEGFEITQATLSRDLKLLKVARLLHPAENTHTSYPMMHSTNVSLTLCPSARWD